MGHLRRAAAVLLIVLTVVVGGASWVGANCIGPTIEYEAREVVPGEAVEVVGTGWGDNCYDTGPPPAGEGLLGRPLRDIEVVVAQGDVDEVVAVGSADEDYGFSVEIPMPAWLEPGEARVSARWAQGPAFDEIDRPFVVLGGAPLDAPATPVAFGPDELAPVPPADAADEAPRESSEASGGFRPSAAAVVAVTMACVAAGVVVLLRPRTGVTPTNDRVHGAAGTGDDQVRGR